MTYLRRAVIQILKCIFLTLMVSGLLVIFMGRDVLTNQSFYYFNCTLFSVLQITEIWNSYFQEKAARLSPKIEFLGVIRTVIETTQLFPNSDAITVAILLKLLTFMDQTHLEKSPRFGEIHKILINSDLHPLTRIMAVEELIAPTTPHATEFTVLPLPAV